jgi:transposase
LPLHEKINCLVDKGYQGIAKIHQLSELPKKKTKNRKLTKEEKKQNRELNRQRIVREHVNRKLKIFRILSERYRNKRKRFGLRFNLIAGIYNSEIIQAS